MKYLNRMIVLLVVLPDQCLSWHWRVVNTPGNAIPGDPIVITVEQE